MHRDLHHRLLVLLCYKVDTSRLFGLAEDIVA
jgi:hypothetical protein